MTKYDFRENDGYTIKWTFKERITDRRWNGEDFTVGSGRKAWLVLTENYYNVSGKAGEAFKDGLKLK